MDSQTALKLPFNLKIIPVNDSGLPTGIPFLAMFNPEQLAIREDVSWTAKHVRGSQGSDLHYHSTRPRSFTLELTIDGTGVNTNGVKIPVTAQVALFRAATTTVQGATHKPAFLLVQYGLFICTCALNNSTVTYTMFDLTGLPIRAKISASFTERVDPSLSNILGMLSSPDLTHRKSVVAGSQLPLMTYEVYKKQDYYLQVARINRVKNIRRLRPGQELVFPPLSDPSKK